MATTTLLVLTLGAALAMIVGVVWILWEDGTPHRRAHSDLRVCEAIWALSSEHPAQGAGDA